MRTFSKVFVLLVITGIIACKKSDDSMPTAGLIKTIQIRTVDTLSRVVDSSKEDYLLTYFPDGKIDSMVMDERTPSVTSHYVARYQRYNGYFLRKLYINYSPTPVHTDSFVTTTKGQLTQVTRKDHSIGFSDTGYFQYNAQNQLVQFRQKWGSFINEFTFDWDGQNVTKSKGVQQYDVKYLYDPSKAIQPADYLNIISLQWWGQPVIQNAHHNTHHKSPLNNDMLVNIQWENGRIRSYDFPSYSYYYKRYSFTYY